MNNKFLENIERIKDLDLVENSDNKSHNFFEFLDKEEINFYLDFLRNKDKLVKIVSEEDENLKKYILLYLMIRNFVNSQTPNIIERKLNTLNNIKNLDDIYQNEILKVYIISGIYFIKENFNHPLINMKKSLIKYFHDLGGIEPGLWGINFKLDILKEIISRKDLEKILTKNNSVKWEHLHMFNYL